MLVFLNTWPLILPWDDINFKMYMYLYGKMALLRLTQIVHYISLNENMFL